MSTEFDIARQLNRVEEKLNKQGLYMEDRYCRWAVKQKYTDVCLLMATKLDYVEGWLDGVMHARLVSTVNSGTLRSKTNEGTN